MDFIIRLTDRISDFNGCVEMIQLTDRFDKKDTKLEEMLIVENRLVEGSFKMSVQELFATIQDATVGDDHIPTPLLPTNCLKHVWVNRVGNVHRVYVEVPKKRWDITYHNQAFKDVGFPRMIFRYMIKNQSVELETIVAVKDQVLIKEDTPIFHFPFSHVSTEGYVCMGGNKFPDVKAIQQLGTFHTVFLSSPFQDDYGAKTTTGKQIREIFTSLKGNDFNDEWLLKKNKTFNEL
ncbi:hypothetical protein AWM68_17775 [Fictibacillus phosphorivorans]|uniref:PRTRC system protein B n=1 Tax=Fictibacillus phosphorivorans TaxID=1221500 RepID=A0A163S2S6_9BACL|nr:hypothetical protein [Fictibacillus phosphorivorans]KZE68019.1 hypothetical protein AWM68_17775 [Fictibacillus phosphorivorans]